MVTFWGNRIGGLTVWHTYFPAEVFEEGADARLAGRFAAAWSCKNKCERKRWDFKILCTYYHPTVSNYIYRCDYFMGNLTQQFSHCGGCSRSGKQSITSFTFWQTHHTSDIQSSKCFAISSAHTHQKQKPALQCVEANQISKQTDNDRTHCTDRHLCICIFLNIGRNTLKQLSRMTWNSAVLLWLVMYTFVWESYNGQDTTSINKCLNVIWLSRMNVEHTYQLGVSFCV